MYVTRQHQLDELCAHARACRRVGLDVEFIREHTYRPQIALVQVAVDGECALVDPLGELDLTPLEALVPDPHITKVLHAGTQDLEIFYLRTGAAPRAIFDTQVAAAMLGLGQQVSYGGLVERVLGVSLRKGEAFTNWLQRPLTPAQEQYALSDVQHLLPMHDRMQEQLALLGRGEWLREELTRFEQVELYVPDPRTLYLRVKRCGTLDPRALAVLRELAAWREEEARREDRPRRRILGDEQLVELARRAPRTAEQLAALRGLGPRVAREHGRALLAAVHQGLAVEDAACPRMERGPRLEPDDQLVVSFLDACLKHLCARMGIDPSMITGAAGLQQLVHDLRRGRLDAERHELLSGWRGDQIGRHLLDVLQGRRALRFDPTRGELVLTDDLSPGDPV